MTNTVTIYTDGGADPATGMGGWSAVLLFNTNNKQYEKEISGGERKTTNNRMELTAMLQGLEALTRPMNVTIYTDSEYLKNGIGYWSDGKPTKPTGWIVNWKQRNWRRKEGILLNDDLWKLLWKACSAHISIQMKWVKGHSGDIYNERCDSLATQARLSITE